MLHQKNASSFIYMIPQFYILCLTSTILSLKQKLVELKWRLSQFWKLEMPMIAVCIMFYSLSDKKVVRNTT